VPKTENSHTVRVRLGKALVGEAIDYVLTINPPFPKQYGVPGRYVGQESITTDNNIHVFQNIGPRRPDGMREYDGPESTVSGVRLKLAIRVEDQSKDEFTVDGAFQLWSESGAELRGNGGWEKE